MEEQAQAARITALKEQVRRERELDQQLAALLGWHSFTPGLHGMMLLGLKAEEPAASGVTSRHEEVPWYSTDVGDAWLIVERMLSHGWRFKLESEYSGWACHLWQDPYVSTFESDGQETAPLAICRTALLAMAPRHPRCQRSWREPGQDALWYCGREMEQREGGWYCPVHGVSDP